MIIDTHTHFYDPTRPQGVPFPPADNELLYRTVLPGHYRALAEPENVTGTVVVEASAWLADNQWIFDLATDEPFLVGLVGHIDPNRSEFGSELEQVSTNPLLRGIRCGGLYFENVKQGSFLEDMALLATKDLQLDVLIREEHIAGLLTVAEQIPELRIVVDHTAHMPVNGQSVESRWQANYERLASSPNVHMKVSAVMEQSIIQPAPTDLDFYRPALDAMWHAFGEDRLIYGSNWPVCEKAGSFADSINIVKAYFAEKGAVATEKYFWKNAKRVYKWLDR